MSTDAEVILRDLHERMTKAAQTLQQMAVDHADDVASDRGARLAAKAAGMRVARSYVDEALRALRADDLDDFSSCNFHPASP